MTTDTLILGGGLSGLHTAFELEKRGGDYLLLEARPRLGGRILSCPAGDEKAAFDLGPAWFWPGQAHIARLLGELRLLNEVFEQYDQGDALYEDASGQIRRGISGISMGGSYRLRGGLNRLIERLRSAVPVEKVHLSCPAERLVQQDDGIDVHCTAGRIFHAAQVVSTLPPRLVAERLSFQPSLPNRLTQFKHLPTWMAGHAKLLVTYLEPFWRKQGLSGDVISHHGPLGEIHDASFSDDGPYALFGFFAIPAAVRRQYSREQLQQACLAQLSKLFGPGADQPQTVLLQDWAKELYTACPADLDPPSYHSSERLQELSDWQGRLIWSGSETADPSGHVNGYLEGALQASEQALSLLQLQSATV